MQNILKDIKSPTVKNIILDTDTYNEIDDQFALAYAMLSPERIKLLSVNAAPFLNSRSTSPADGMMKSYNEIQRIMRLVDPDAAVPYYKGSERFLDDKKVPVESEAADNIINTVMGTDDRVYIVAIGAITNVASAIIKCPEIAERAVVIWLGGHALTYKDTREFNLYQDVMSAQVVFDSGIPLIQIPCAGMCTEFVTTIPELEYYLRGKNELCDYLVDIVRSYTKKPYGWSKVVWDVTAVAVLVCPEAFRYSIIPRPYVTLEGRYAFNTEREQYIYVNKLSRDPVYADLFIKLSNK
ncbi:MAG: nucleoside hydrolase [Eubacteriales bacterium]|nr:nucleoside hydrolase [Eubacteriales bacterium]MDY4898505.1 nucleoside hydrolase [Eubacteriales bacterium]